MKSRLARVVSLTIGVLALALWAPPARADWVAEYTTAGVTVNPSLFTFDGSGGGLLGTDSNEIAAAGNCLFVANTYANTIGQYTTSGAVVNAALISSADGLSFPTAIAASGGDLYILAQTNFPVQTATNLINLYDGPDMFYFPLAAGPPNSFSHSIAVSGGDIFASFANNVYPYPTTVAEYDTNGNVVNASLISGLSGPQVSVAVSGSDLFVLNTTTGTLSEYTTAGSLINASLIGYLDDATAITISGSDMFIVYDSGARIGEWTTSGTLVNPTFYNTGTGTFWSDGIAASGDDVFVSLFEVPEPSSFVLLAMGAAPMLAWRLRKRIVLHQIQEFGCHWLCQCRELR